METQVHSDAAIVGTCSWRQQEAHLCLISSSTLFLPDVDSSEGRGWGMVLVVGVSLFLVLELLLIWEGSEQKCPAPERDRED